MNELADFFRSKEEREKLKQIELLRRKGERFITVRYEGTIIPDVDSEGICYNLRIHGLKDIEAYEVTDMNTGKTDWKTRKGARNLFFRQTSTGEIEGNIWDDPDHWNRHFISTHPELVVVDEILSKEIEEEKKKPFKSELTRKEELEREIADKVKELDQITEEEKKAKKKDGVNKSTPSVDSP